MVMLENQEFLLSSGEKNGFSRQIAMFVLTKEFSRENCQILKVRFFIFCQSAIFVLTKEFSREKLSNSIKYTYPLSMDHKHWSSPYANLEIV